MIFNKIFKKEYNLHAFDLKTNSKYTIQLFQNKKEARNYLQKLLDSNLNDFLDKTQNENTLINDYLKKRRYSYKIKNDNFDEIKYIKDNASRIYKKHLSSK